MSAIRDGRYPIMLDKERHLLYDLNAIDMIQERFGDLAKIGEAMTGKDGFKNLRFLLTVLLNEGEKIAEGTPKDIIDLYKKLLSNQQVGKLIHVGNLNAVKDAIFAAISVGNTGSAVPAEADEDDAKNAETGKAK